MLELEALKAEVHVGGRSRLHSPRRVGTAWWTVALLFCNIMNMNQIIQRVVCSCLRACVVCVARPALPFSCAGRTAQSIG